MGNMLVHFHSRDRLYPVPLLPAPEPSRSQSTSVCGVLHECVGPLQKSGGSEGPKE